MGAFLRKYRGVLILLLVVILGVSAYVYMQRASTDTASQYQTVKIERGNLVATIGATGTVRAKQSAVLNWQVNGSVDTVNVKVGDNVPGNFVMAFLKKTSLPQNIILAEADLANAQTTLDNLLNSNAALAKAEQDLANAKQAVEDAQKDVTKLDYRRYSDDMLKQAKDELILAKRNVSRAEDYFKLFKDRSNGDADKAQAELNLINARTARDQKQAVIEWYLGTPDELDAAKYRAALSVALAQEADAQRTYDRLAGGNLVEIESARARVDASQATLNLSRIVAPFPGIVTEALPLPGDQVSAGVTAYRLDNLSSLYVDVEVSEVDINSVSIGQPATLSFDAILNKEYHGKVVEVAKVGNNVGGVVNFTVTVELTDVDDFVKPGMTAAVSVVVQEEKDVLLIPNRAVRLVDNERVVYMLVDGQPKAFTVLLGSTSGIDSVLVGGDIKEGDMIILNPPSNNGGPFGG
jgi:HlyD family secretion protein